jgi:acetolactate synthase-1/2/3 large subunit
MWASLFFDAYSPKTFLSSAGLGTMGFGFPAALGAKVANPKNAVMCLTGEGSFLMTEQELATSVEEHIPVIVVILNNRSLGMVAQWQRTFYGGRYSAVDLGISPDFVKLAQAFGAEGARVEAYEELPKIVREALSNDVTTVIDVPISPEEDVYPFVIPGKPLDTPLLGREYERKT